MFVYKNEHFSGSRDEFVGKYMFPFLRYYRQCVVQGTAVTKVKINQKEKEGIAEKRRGKRGPSSVWGSSAAGVACAIASLFGLGGSSFYSLWKLGYVASFATKLSDTVSSEIGKAYGKST